MKKIMFNDKYGLTKDVIEGRKTQTRRIINPQPMYDENVGICWKGYAYGINFSGKEGAYNNFISGTEYDKSCKRYRVGEIVAVAQSYEVVSDILSRTPSKERAEYYCKIMKTCYPKEEIPRDKEDIAGWTNKMFVKAELMPHQIRITNVRIERLQDISDDDCLAEGIVVNEPKIKGGVKSYYPCEYLKSCADKVGWGRVFDTPRKAYAELIDKVSGKGTWESNPYVFVYNFELIK